MEAERLNHRSLIPLSETRNARGPGGRSQRCLHSLWASYKLRRPVHKPLASQTLIYKPPQGVNFLQARDWIRAQTEDGHRGPPALLLTHDSIGGQCPHSGSGSNLRQRRRQNNFPARSRSGAGGRGRIGAGSGSLRPISSLSISIASSSLGPGNHQLGVYSMGL